MKRRYPSKPLKSAPQIASNGVVVLADVPGAFERIAAEKAKITRLRELSFMDINLLLCGVEVQQLKPRHWQILSIAENPITLGGDVSSFHAVQFLWVVSAGFSRDAEVAQAFAERLGMEDDFLPEVIEQIDEYISDAFMDRRAGSPTSFNFMPSTCVTASIRHDLYKAYGWTPERISETPFGAIFQHLKLIDEDMYRAAGLNVPKFSRIDKLTRQIFADYEASRQTSQNG